MPDWPEFQIGARLDLADWCQIALACPVMGPKQKIQAEANSKKSSGPHDVGEPSAAPHHIVAAAPGGRHHLVIHHVVR